jgi:hypothetical protein
MGGNDQGVDAALYVLGLTEEAIPARWREDTASELLTLVQMTFHDYVAAVLAEPIPPVAQPQDGTTPLAMRAALHGRAVADLLTALAIDHWRETGGELSERGIAEAPATLTREWLDQIAELARGKDRPNHETAADYVRGAAITLSFVARILGAQRGFSLDPNDPRGPVELPEDSLGTEDAGALLIWCAAAAVGIAAKLQPEFRVAG